MGIWSEYFGSRAKELRVIRERAEAGDAEAQIKLSKMYLYGDVVDRSFRAAEYWATKAIYSEKPIYANEARELSYKIIPKERNKFEEEFRKSADF